MRKLARTELHRTWIHRERFLVALAAEAPEVMEDFRNTVIGGVIDGFRAIHYMHFEPFLDHYRSSDWQRTDLPDPILATLDFMRICANAFTPTFDDPADTVDAKRVIAGDIRNWLVRWNLEAPWMREVAISNGYWGFMNWLNTGQLEAPSVLSTPDSVKEGLNAIEVEGDEIVTHRHPYPAFEFRLPAAYAQHLHLDVDILEQRLSRWLDEAKTRYLDEIHAANAKNGVVKLPVAMSEAEHFRWLVHYQVLTKSHSEAARDCGANVETIKKTVPEMAKLIDLRLRPPKKPGRPKGS